MSPIQSTTRSSSGNIALSEITASPTPTQASGYAQCQATRIVRPNKSKENPVGSMSQRNQKGSRNDENGVWALHVSPDEQEIKDVDIATFGRGRGEDLPRAITMARGAVRCNDRQHHRPDSELKSSLRDTGRCSRLRSSVAVWYARNR